MSLEQFDENVLFEYAAAVLTFSGKKISRFDEKMGKNVILKKNPLKTCSIRNMNVST